ncbi:PAN domain-containing protein [Piscinibacterium candidicorallinum]|uniref:PAN domain-containing protein n=1 Tax=Piscinibacterium candidicorallinum TaxID=1793872 RepID=A0ABV7H3T0_9BURK
MDAINACSRVLRLAVCVLAMFAVAWPAAWAGSRVVREPQVDRPGRDFYQFVMTKPDPEICVAACMGNSRCRAFTYVRPGYQARQAKCYLKDAGTKPVANVNALSGLKIATQSPPPREPDRIETSDAFGQKQFCEMGLMCDVNQVGRWNSAGLGQCQCSPKPRE